MWNGGGGEGSAMAMASPPRRRLLFQPLPGSVPCQPLPNCLFPWPPFPPLPPLPPPPPPPPLSYDPAATIRFKHRRSSLVPTLPVAASSLVAAAVLAILVTFFFLRLRRRRRRRLGLLDAAPPGADAPLDEEDGGNGEEDIHHVWYIRTVGLDESTIGTITAWAYKADDGVLASSATDCAVCLSEFCDGELVRLLPNCGHAFHVSCIDTWLRSHVNCPLCRAPVVVPNSAASSGDPGTSTSTDSSSSSSDGFSLPSPESTLNHTEPNWVASAQVDSNRTDGDGRRLGHDRGAMEEEMDAERSELAGRSRTAGDPIARSQLPVSIDSMENGFQPIRRSASMDAIIGALELEEGLFEILRRKKPASEAEWNHRTTRAKHSSRVTCLRKEVERSSSGSCSDRFLLSIRGRCRSSLLPL